MTTRTTSPRATRWSLPAALALVLAGCPGADKPPPQSPKSPEQMPPGSTPATTGTTPNTTGTQPPVTGTSPTGTTPEPGTPLVPPTGADLPKTVKLKLVAVPKAKVRWGKKTLGVTPLAFERPRDSGPVDLVFLASGYFPVHTRAFTYKSDSLYISMTKLSDRHKLYGAKKDPPPAAPCDPTAGPCAPATAPTGTTPGVPVPSVPVAPGTPPLPLPPIPTTKPAPSPTPAPAPAPAPAP